MRNFYDSLLSIAGFSPSFMGYPSAWHGHIPFAAWLVGCLRPKILVELGTHYGNSYFAFCQSVKAKALGTSCFAVDTWQGDEHAGYYGDDVYQTVLAENDKHYSAFSTLLRKTFDDAVGCFGDGSINLLHIDGLHTYNAVKHDFETWRVKLAPGALVLFHDINVRIENFGVWQLWQELCLRYPWHIEFMHSFGLGVIKVDDVALPEEFSWLKSGSEMQVRVKDYFAALGAHEVQKEELISARKTLGEYSARFSECSAQLAECNAQLAERNEQIFSVLRSRSWQITSPLRSAGAAYRRVRRLLDNYQIYRRLP